MSWIKKARSTIFPTEDERKFRYYLHMSSVGGPNSNGTFKFDVAWGYAHGKGVEQNANEALLWFEKTANSTDIYEDGNPSGAYELFYWYYYGRNRCASKLTIPVDYNKATYWGHRYMTSSTYVSPVYLLTAKIHQNGMPGVAQNKSEALAIYRYMGHGSQYFSNFKRSQLAALYHPEVEYFTCEIARRQVWELETGQNQHEAPEWFMNSELWHRRPVGNARRNKNGELYYKSFDLWGPHID